MVAYHVSQMWSFGCISIQWELWMCYPLVLPALTDWIPAVYGWKMGKPVQDSQVVFTRLKIPKINFNDIQKLVHEKNVFTSVSMGRRFNIYPPDKKKKKKRENMRGWFFTLPPKRSLRKTRRSLICLANSNVPPSPVTHKLPQKAPVQIKNSIQCAILKCYECFRCSCSVFTVWPVNTGFTCHKELQMPLEKGEIIFKRKLFIWISNG